MRTTRFSDSYRDPLPGKKPPFPWTETPLDRDLPGRNMGPGTETALEGTWDQTAGQEKTS